MKKITVITVTYNSSKYIERLIQAVQNSAKYIHEIVIVDNDSPDITTTNKIVDRQTKKSKIPIRLFHHQNKGFATSCNFAAKFVTTSHILFLNPDTKPNANSINILFEHHLEAKADISGSKLVNEHAEEGVYISKLPNLYYGIFHLSNIGKILHYDSARLKFLYKDADSKSKYVEDSDVETVSGACMLISKYSFSKLAGFDEKIFLYLEDVDLCYRAKKCGMKIIFCPHSIISHTGGASSSNPHRINQQAWFKSRAYYYAKNTNLLTNFIIQPIFMIDQLATKLRNDFVCHSE